MAEWKSTYQKNNKTSTFISSRE